jgi:hypothetical protein
MRLIPLIVIPAATLVALSGCAFAPRGPVVSEDRGIGAATAVELRTSGDLTIKEGEPALTIHAPAAVLDSLTSSVEDGVLVLDVAPGTPGFLVGRISYELTLPSLQGLEVDGSGDVSSDVPGESLDIEINGSGDLDIQDIDASAVTLEISGSGDVELSGRADELTLSIRGSGDVRAGGLDAERVAVDINGLGDVAVSASEALDVALSGAGTVRYQGDPEITQKISGAGEVKRG